MICIFGQSVFLDWLSYQSGLSVLFIWTVCLTAVWPLCLLYCLVRLSICSVRFNCLSGLSTISVCLSDWYICLISLSVWSLCLTRQSICFAGQSVKSVCVLDQSVLSECLGCLPVGLVCFSVWPVCKVCLIWWYAAWRTKLHFYGLQINARHAATACHVKIILISIPKMWA